MKGESIGDAALLMAEGDTVATALEDLSPGRELPVEGGSVAVVEEIPFGHKVALERIAAGDPVRKYGEVIGTARDAIEPGEWVHTHNCESNRGRGDRAVKGGER